MAKRLIDNFGLFVLDLFFPNRCPFCGEFIKWNELCCERCSDSLIFANDVICRLCGQEKCCCYKENYEFDRVYAAYFFDDGNDGEVRSAVYRFKHEGEANFPELAADNCVKHITGDGVMNMDMIVPVPMGRKKQRARGHNQAELFGKSIGKRLDIPVRRDILFKYDTDDEQHFHTGKERRERVKKLFYTGDADLTGKNILLCDDVMTTGSTLSECAAILKSMGAESVAAVVCAITRLRASSHKP